MNDTSTDRIAASREAVRGFGHHYNYDVTYMEALMDVSPGAYQAFEGGMSMGRYQKAAPTELLSIVKITATWSEDCGPCTVLCVKIAREAGVSESIIRGALQGGKGLSPEHLDIYRYARAIAANEDMDPEFLPRLEARWGREVIAELAVAIVASRLFPTLKRALGHAKSCALMPELIS
jgi:alkylhydroperoxidase family enzyme